MSVIAAQMAQLIHALRDSLPLVDEFCAVLRIRESQRLRKNRGGCVQPVAEGDANGELTAFAEIDLRHYGHIAVLGALKFPVHGEVVVDVLPAIAEAHKAAGGAPEVMVASHCQPRAVLPGKQYVPSGNFRLLC